ncbi:hypothetical protein ACN27F_26765 [Solwaraspora sp. WMMB335]|uniref:hypothetical protein n=1 Tax=Solwaraspora sp. WMMB335 TaxID=3404118 RepID=UPI003B94ECE0
MAETERRRRRHRHSPSAGTSADSRPPADPRPPADSTPPDVAEPGSTEVGATAATPPVHDPEPDQSVTAASDQSVTTASERRVGAARPGDPASIHRPRRQTLGRSGPTTAADDRDTDRGLRGLVGSGTSQVSTTTALRARDASRPRAADLTAAEESLTIVRRHWVPRDELPRRDR